MLNHLGTSPRDVEWAETIKNAPHFYTERTGRDFLTYALGRYLRYTGYDIVYMTTASRTQLYNTIASYCRKNHPSEPDFNGFLNSLDLSVYSYYKKGNRPEGNRPERNISTNDFPYDPFPDISDDPGF